MDQAIADFTTHLRDRNRSPLTIARYTDLLRRFARFAYAELHQDTVAPSQIDKALVVLFVREGGVTSAQASAATRNSRLAAIRAFFRHMVTEERLARDPTAGLHSATLPERAPTFLTAEEFTKLRRVVESNAAEFYLRRDLAISGHPLEHRPAAGGTAFFGFGSSRLRGRGLPRRAPQGRQGSACALQRRRDYRAPSLALATQGVPERHHQSRLVLERPGWTAILAGGGRPHRQVRHAVWNRQAHHSACAPPLDSDGADPRRQRD